MPDDSSNADSLPGDELRTSTAAARAGSIQKWGFTVLTDAGKLLEGPTLIEVEWLGIEGGQTAWGTERQVALFDVTAANATIRYGFDAATGFPIGGTVQQTGYQWFWFDQGSGPTLGNERTALFLEIPMKLGHQDDAERPGAESGTLPSFLPKRADCKWEPWPFSPSNTTSRLAICRGADGVYAGTEQAGSSWRIYNLTEGTPWHLQRKGPTTADPSPFGGRGLPWHAVEGPIGNRVWIPPSETPTEWEAFVDASMSTATFQSYALNKQDLYLILGMLSREDLVETIPTTQGGTFIGIGPSLVATQVVMADLPQEQRRAVAQEGTTADSLGFPTWSSLPPTIIPRVVVAAYWGPVLGLNATHEFWGVHHQFRSDSAGSLLWLDLEACEGNPGARFAAISAVTGQLVAVGPVEGATGAFGGSCTAEISQP